MEYKPQNRPSSNPAAVHSQLDQIFLNKRYAENLFSWMGDADVYY